MSAVLPDGMTTVKVEHIKDVTRADNSGIQMHVLMLYDALHQFGFYEFP